MMYFSELIVITFAILGFGQSTLPAWWDNRDVLEQNESVSRKSPWLNGPHNFTQYCVDGKEGGHPYPRDCTKFVACWWVGDDFLVVLRNCNQCWKPEGCPPMVLKDNYCEYPEVLGVDVTTCMENPPPKPTEKPTTKKPTTKKPTTKKPTTKKSTTKKSTTKKPEKSTLDPSGGIVTSPDYD